MLLHIYDIVSKMMAVLFLLLVAHYVFLEPMLKKGRLLFWLLCLTGTVVTEFGNLGDFEAFFPFVMVGIYIAISRRNKRIRGFFMWVPLLGLGYGLSLLSHIPILLFGITSEEFPFGYYAVTDVFDWILVLLFWRKGKKWRANFEQELQYRNLEKWERRLLLLVSWLCICSSCFILEMEEQPPKEMTMSMRISIGMMCITLFSLAVAIVIVVWQGNKQAYYRGIAQMNERYLKAELKHFQAYQQTQTATRRIRHDMKNQMASLNHFVRQKDWQTVQRYMDEICDTVENIDCSLHCGNSLADAIINEKQQLAMQKGIRFELEGKMPERTYLDPVDICTIFSNALDNGIEALDNNKIAQEQRWFRIEIGIQGQVLFLSFKNPVAGTQLMGTVGETTKADTLHHGFGLQNIGLAAKKYHGNISVRIEEAEVRLFVLEVMLMNDN